MKTSDQGDPDVNRLSHDWTVTRFGELLAEQVSNGVYKKKEFHGRGQKIINMGELFAYDFISDQEMKRVELSSREVSKYLLRDGDLLFARRSLVLEGSGKCSLMLRPSEQTTFESSIIRARLHRDKADPKFYYYLFRSPLGRALMASIATRTAVSGIRGSDLVRLEVLRPPLVTQKKIASVLSAYDDLIENNLRCIAILEEMTQLIYREWFVHLRFPGHEEAAIVDSPFGPIPEGWELLTLSDLVECRRDGTTPGEHLSDRWYVPIDCIPRHSLALLEASPWQEAKSSLQLFEDNDILFGAMRPYFHKVVVAPFRGVTRTTCFVLRARRPELAAYATMLMFQDETVAFASAHSRGTTIPYAVWEGSLAQMPVLLPPTHLLDRFHEHGFPMLQILATKFARMRNLRSTRDLLLPKLISGELDVAELDIDTGGLDA